MVVPCSYVRASIRQEALTGKPISLQKRISPYTLKLRISCHVQHLVKGSAVNIYDSNIESFVPSKKQERDEAPPAIS